jgi:hypothetical protein
MSEFIIVPIRNYNKMKNLEFKKKKFGTMRSPHMGTNGRTNERSDMGTNGQTNGPTNIVSYIGATSRLKTPE